jgi:hypothetical protein
LFLAGCPGSDGEPAEGEEPACELTSTVVVDAIAGSVTAMSVGSTEVVFVVRDDAFVTHIESVPLAGGDRTTLHTSAGGDVVVSVLVVGSDVLFLETPAGEQASALFSLPLGGGAPTAIGMSTWAGAERLVAADADSAYVVYLEPNSVIDRVDRASGDSSRVGSADGTGTPSHPQLAGTDLFFVAGMAGETGPSTVYRLDATGNDAAAEAVGAIGADQECGFPLGGLTATASALVCGFSAVASYARADVTQRTTLVPGEPSKQRVVVGSSGETVYTIELSNGTTAVRMNKIASSGGDLTPVACDLHKVANQSVDASFPAQNAYQVGFSESDVVWVEQSADATSYSIRKAPK